MNDHFTLALGIILWAAFFVGYYLVNRYTPQVLRWVDRVFVLTPPYDDPR